MQKQARMAVVRRAAARPAAGGLPNHEAPALFEVRFRGAATTADRRAGGVEAPARPVHEPAGAAEGPTGHFRLARSLAAVGHRQGR
ncbi:MAG: hypothetical protein AAGF12_13455 [Myxococcota bacterium]